MRNLWSCCIFISPHPFVQAINTCIEPSTLNTHDAQVVKGIMPSCCSDPVAFYNYGFPARNSPVYLLTSARYFDASLIIWMCVCSDTDSTKCKREPNQPEVKSAIQARYPWLHDKMSILLRVQFTGAARLCGVSQKVASLSEINR